MVSDPDLLDAVLRLAAAAGCELQRAVDPPQARAFWSTAPLVLLDAAAAAQCARAGLPRRGEVVLAVRGEPQAAVWRHAVAVGAEHVVALPEAEQWLVAALTDAGGGPASRRQRARRHRWSRRSRGVGVRGRGRRHGGPRGRPGAAGRLRPARRRARPRTRRGGPGRAAVAGGRRRGRSGPGRGAARGAAVASGRSSRGRARRALLRSQHPRADARRGACGGRGGPPGRRDRGVRPPALSDRLPRWPPCLSPTSWRSSSPPTSASCAAGARVAARLGRARPAGSGRGARPCAGRRRRRRGGQGTGAPTARGHAP